MAQPTSQAKPGMSMAGNTWLELLSRSSGRHRLAGTPVVTTRVNIKLTSQPTTE
jgi:hypothetical protein